MRKIICLLSVCLLALVFNTPSFAVGSRIFFDETQIDAGKDDEFEMLLMLDTGGQEVSGADVVLQFNPVYLELLSIENGGFFPLFGKHFEINNQKIYITGFFPEKNQTKNASGVFAKLILKALKNGETSLNFNCAEKSLSDTNILDRGGNDILVCANLRAVLISIQGSSLLFAKSNFGRVLGTESGALVPTSTPTLYPTATPTSQAATSSGMMETGVFEDSILLLTVGAALILLGFFLFNFSQRRYSYVDIDSLSQDLLAQKVKF